MSNPIIAKTVFFQEAGTSEVLKVEQAEIAYPGSQEVRIKVKSIGINRADAMYRLGMLYADTLLFPAKLGYEASGTVEAVGADVTDLSVGDAISIIPGFPINLYSTYGEYIIMPIYAVTKHPENLSFEEAAALWMSYITMYGMIIRSGELKPGEFVVINAASSSAGLAAIQTTNYAGGISIAITTSTKKKDALLKAGASHVIVTSEEDVKIEIMKITKNAGAHIILDPVVGKNFGNLISTVAQNGKIFLYGALSNEPASFSAYDVLIKTPTIRGYSSIEVLVDSEALKQAITYIKKGVEEGKLKPIVDKKVFNLDEIVESHQYLESNQQFGKIVVNV